MKLGDIATSIYRGSGIKREQVTEDGIPCVRYGEIYGFSLFVVGSTT